MCMAGGYVGGGLVEDWSNGRNFRRDLYILEYRRLHPELFPEKGKPGSSNAMNEIKEREVTVTDKRSSDM